MPNATLIILSSNNLQLFFNDTLFTNPISQSDLSIRIFGNQLSYDFTWNAEFLDNSTVEINMTIYSTLEGNKVETVYVNFINPDNFKSIYSKRGVNPQELSGYLYKGDGIKTSATSLGETTMIVFLCSVALGFISSFGGNSMEMIWNLMNTLQLIFFLSYTYVNFPQDVSIFFDYLKYSNAENPFLSTLTFLVIPKHNFTRGSVNDRLNEKAFFVNSADKVPILIGLVIAFTITLIFDFIHYYYREIKSVKFHKIMKILTYFKYNFFIRFWMEVYLEVTINSMIN